MVPEPCDSPPEVLLLGCYGDHLRLPGGYTLGWGVAADGTAWPVIIDDHITGRSPLPYAHLEREAPAHERTGRLPAVYREALQHHCGAPTAKGRPCRMVVAGPGQRCDFHREAGP